MENASKALIVAAGVLIAVMIASFMMLVLRKAGRMSAEYESQRSDLELANFNSQFEYFARENNTYFDIMTVANMAYDVNHNNQYDANNNVQIKIWKGNHVAYSILLDKNLKRNYFFDREDKNKQIDMYDSDLLEYTKLKSDIEEEYTHKFVCTKTDYHDITGKVKEMHFKIENN